MRGTRIRFRVAALGTALAMVTYLDRVSMGTIAPIVTREWQLTPSQTGWIFSAFALAYAMFEIPTAKWAEKLGHEVGPDPDRPVVVVFTAATALAFNLPSMLLVRFLFGAGEAGAWPMAARAFSSWIPRLERATVQGIFFAGAHLVGGLTPPLIGLMLRPHELARDVRGLRSRRLGLGCRLAEVVRERSRGSPRGGRGGARAHPARPAAGQQTHGRPRILGPVVLQPQRRAAVPDVSVEQHDLLLLHHLAADLPEEPARLRRQPRSAFSRACRSWSACRAICSAARLSDRLCAKYGMRVGRCYLGAVAYALTSAFLFLAASSSTPIVAAVAIAIATGLTMLTLGAAWGTCIEVARNHAGVVGAVMNTSGQVASLLIPLVVGYSVEWFNNWDFPIYMLACMFLVGAVCWLLIDPHKPVFDEHVA